MKLSDLTPCPSCGAGPLRDLRIDSYRAIRTSCWRITCLRCGAATATHDTEREVATAWGNGDVVKHHRAS